ncbi:acyl-homoserine-lactone synthase [Kordiimonas aestuarii]|uniref:acyl-homoserine-lactone synthase n=1 Tax=Kordiimonas aestuarii TaxID=1005925 RepID=UPI0021CE49E1|nr:acyl-homoserine-lactone synthase [Kordiimonas aestuarii]
MIHVVSAHNKAEYKSYLRQLWQQRYDVFVEKMGWSLDCADGIERDQFDRPDTVYLLCIDEKDRLKGGMRLLPTTKPHLMSDLFPHLCAEGVPSGDTTWEISRFYSLTGRHMMLERDKTASELICGLYEYALMNRIEKVSCVASMVLFPTILKAGWDVTPLGLPTVTDDEVILAFLIDLNERDYKTVAQNRKITESVLYAPNLREEQWEIAV